MLDLVQVAALALLIVLCVALALLLMHVRHTLEDAALRLRSRTTRSSDCWPGPALAQG